MPETHLKVAANARQLTPTQIGVVFFPPQEQSFPKISKVLMSTETQLKLSG